MNCFLYTLILYIVLCVVKINSWSGLTDSSAETKSLLVIAGSVAVLAEILLRSPRFFFWVYQNIYIYRIRLSMKNDY